MLLPRGAGQLCSNCREALYLVFSTGFTTVRRTYPRRVPRRNVLPKSTFRTFSATRSLKFQDQTDTEPFDGNNVPEGAPYEQLEEAARRARDDFGATLPAGELSPEVYKIYERLYGPPLKETLPGENVEESAEPAETEADQGAVLYREGEDGELEEVEDTSLEEESEMLNDDPYSTEKFETESDEEYAARMVLLRDIAEAGEIGNANEGEAPVLTEDQEPQLSEEEREHDESSSRSHPYTQAGRFATYPTSIHLPKDAFVEPVCGILRPASNRQLAECTKRTFGGDMLPDSVATPSGKGHHLQQKPIALEASQSRMGPMEANSYIAANMPGAYASVMSTLIETRRRLGSGWIEGLLRKEGGPKVLDAGAAGAGVLAWHEVLKAEWARMHSGSSSPKSVPLGKATVVTGSSELRKRVSLLLENTTFLPRIQDFLPLRDLPGAPKHDPTLRKQYDLIIAPHTLWTMKEDYMRKAQVQNYFTLLNPNGGVLIIIEKGVPRGFELVAGAREVLLKHHIISPGVDEQEVEIQTTKSGRIYSKEPGMIVAPCTNHTKCPMYKIPGQMTGRKDHCHFSQRFLRPPFLQRILGAKHHNHEDINFSYLAVRRGIDERSTRPIPQDEESTRAALQGYQGAEAQPDALTLPRLVAPPIKRHKHVTFDLCTPAANLERWTVSKSFSRQAYRDARKAQWGDLWALGAKTRVIRTARSGSAKERPAKRVKEDDFGPTEEEDVLRDLTKGLYKRAKEGRKGSKKLRKLAEGDLM